MNTYQCRSRKRNEKQAMRNYGERDEALIPRGNSSGAFVTVFLVLQDLIKLALRTTLKSTASVFPSSPVLNSKCQSVWQQRVTLPLITSRLAQKVLLNFFVWNPKMKRVKKKNLTEINDYVKRSSLDQTFLSKTLNFRAKMFSAISRFFY